MKKRPLADKPPRRRAKARVIELPARGAERYLPDQRNWEALEARVQRCRGCDLYRNATQAVFGRGTDTSRIFLVGEQPGDVEDRRGLPFVGPAGKMLRRAVTDARLPANEIYYTNAVKHFKFRPSGKRRLHQKPRDGEIEACYPWLVAEVEALHPVVVVCLGASAARSAILKSNDFNNL